MQDRFVRDAAAQHRAHRQQALQHMEIAETVPESHAGLAAFASVYVLLAIDLALLRIARATERIARRLEHGPTLNLHATIVSKGDAMQLPALSLDVAHDIALTTSPQDADGNPTTPTLRWESSDPQIFSLQVAPDTLSARAVTTGNLGHAVIAVTNDAGLTDSVAADVSAVPPPPPGTLNLAAQAVPKL